MTKTILITGSTDGIGKLAALKLAQQGHEMFVHGRNAEKLAEVVSELKHDSGNHQIDGFVADFSDLEAVKRMADEVITRCPKLDVLINNAGVYKSPKPKNNQGQDMRMMVNYLAPVVLTRKLLPLLEKGTRSRIINLSSAAQASVDMQLLKGEIETTEQAGYAQSKLALTMWSYHLAKELEGMTVIPVNPGSLLNTNMVKEAFGTHWSSADKGAEILFRLAVSPDFEGISGKYFDNDYGAFGRPHTDVFDEKKLQTLIEATNQLTS